MPDQPIVLAVLALIGMTARVIALCLRNRRNPNPAAEQLLEGVGWGAALGLAIIGIAILLAPS